MSTTLEFDAIATTQIEAIYATPDVAATRIAAFRAASPRFGQTVVDVGCGPGFFLHELAKAVGPQGQAIGVDISDTMLALARRKCAGLNHVRLENAEARDLPLANEAADVACGLRVFGYVKELVEALEELRRVVRPGGHVVILDTDFAGVVWESQDQHCDDGMPDFHGFRSDAGAAHACLYAFDLLMLDGEDLRRQRLDVRRGRLADLLHLTDMFRGLPASIRYSAAIEGEGPTIFAHACRLGLEGIMSKRRSAPYRSGRDPNWRKIKSGYAR